VVRGNHILDAILPVGLDGPSFDCGGKLSAAERAICERPRLHAYDKLMSAIYVLARREFDDAELGSAQQN
jgi:uncharacterized protein